MPLLLLLLLALAPIAWIVGQPLWRGWQRRRLRARPFPSAWRAILRRRVPLVARLPVDLQLELKRHILVFLAEKPFIGCQGLVVTDEMRVTVAAQACLLLLGRRRPDYFPALRQILLYPGAFVVDRVRPQGAGVLAEQRQVLAGESWSQGQVILSWADALEGAAVPDDGRNVVLHEFAHQLDQQGGAATGAPAIASRRRRERWARVCHAAYAELQRRVAAGQPSCLSAYGASEPAEFFAVATEVFFEQPAALAAEYPALYRELALQYRVHPLVW